MDDCIRKYKFLKLTEEEAKPQRPISKEKLVC